MTTTPPPPPPSDAPCAPGTAFGNWEVPARTAPIKLTDVPWRYRTMLAPLEGVTNALYREMIAANGGVGIVCTEFVRVSKNPIRRETLAAEVVRLPDTPLSVQVMGNEVERMQEAAAVIAAHGADVVDINLGCPAPRVVRKGVGSAMLKDPDLLYRVISAMRAVVPGLLSAKIRAGFDDQAQVVTIAQTVEAAGADYIVVHPRRRADFYAGVADWRIIRVLRENLTIPVIGNGDCWYAVDAARMRAETGCHAVMLGRPCMRNPWIFQQIMQLDEGLPVFRPSGADVVGFLEDFAIRYQRAWPDHLTGPVGRLKELLTWVGRAVPDEDFRRDVLRKPDMRSVLDHCAAVIGPMPAEVLDLGPSGTLERSGSAILHPEEPLLAPARWAGGGK